MSEQISIEKETYQALMDDRKELLQEVIDLREQREKIIASMKQHIIEHQVITVTSINDTPRTVAIKECIAIVEMCK